MVAPLMALAGSLGGMYAVGKTYDNVRYWNAYYRNTGFRPKYPFRSGSMDWMSYSARGFGTVGSSLSPRRYNLYRNVYIM